MADFGLARTKRHFFVAGTSGIGTPEWTAPEVLKGEPFNERADVYSYGVILWEIATRARPFHGMMPHQVMAAVGFNNQQLPREPLATAGAAPALVELMYECMALRWQDRPTFEAIIARLDPIAAEHRQQRSTARPPPTTPSSRADPRETNDQ